MPDPIVIYQPEGHSIEVRLDTAKETLWLSLQQIADLFERDKSVVSRHLKNIFESAELSRESTVAKNATTANDGKTYQVDYYNLDVVISVGYRVNSVKGTQFRIWATKTLRDHLTQGWTLSRQRMESNARELEAVLQLIQKTAQSPELNTDSGLAALTLLVAESSPQNKETMISLIINMLAVEGNA